MILKEKFKSRLEEIDRLADAIEREKVKLMKAAADDAGFPVKITSVEVDLAGVFSQGPHHVNNVDNLKLSLFAGLYRFLACYHQHRHGSKLGVCRSRNQVRGSRTKGG